MKVFIVTGTPGAGKTSFAKKLARKKRAGYVDVSNIVKEEKLYSKYDKSLRSYVADINKVVKYLQRLIKTSKNDLVIDSHLSHHLPAKYVDICYVMKCDLKKLKKRLVKRGYSKNKVRENLDAEILQVCLLEALLNKHKVKVVDASKKRL